MQSPGAPLADAPRTDFEARFGHDFSQVRIHSGPETERSTQALQARAFTFGDHVVVRPSENVGLGGQGATGRRLIAHELAHVVQQRAGGAPSVQRQPAPPDGGTAPPQPTPAPTTTAPTPTTTTAAATPEEPSPITNPTPGRTPLSSDPETEGDAAADTDFHYKTDAEVDGAFASPFSDHSDFKKQLVTYADKRQFLSRMSLFLGKHPATEKHYATFKKPSEIPGEDIMHGRAAEQQDKVAAKLKARGKTFPQSGGFQLRSRWQGDFEPMGHPLGLAFDYNANLNPHVKDPRMLVVQRAVVGEQFRAKTTSYVPRRKTIIQMAQRRADQPPTQEELDYQQKLRDELTRTAEASDRFRTLLTPDQLKELWKVENALHDARLRKKQIEQGLKAPNPSGDLVDHQMGVLTAMEALTEQKHELLAPLLTKIEALKVPYAAAAGKGTSKELDAKALEAKRTAQQAVQVLERAKADLKRKQQALAAAAARFKAASEALAAATNPSARLQTRNREAGEALAKRLTEQQGASVTFGTATARQAETKRDAEGAEKLAYDAKALEAIDAALRAIDQEERFVYDHQLFETGALEARDPSLLQLLSHGFFNPDTDAKRAAAVAAKAAAPPKPKRGEPPLTEDQKAARAVQPESTRKGWDIEFMLEMRAAGFDQGVEWEPGGVDSMHLELAEVMNKVKNPKVAKGQREDAKKKAAKAEADRKKAERDAAAAAKKAERDAARKKKDPNAPAAPAAPGKKTP